MQWYMQAACRGVVLLMVPESKREEKRAKKICAGCPADVECLEYALERPHLHGVWGGATENERTEIRERRREMKQRMNRRGQTV